MLIKRHEINYLINWTAQRQRKPLILRGARQVGKSTAVRQLAIAAALDLIELNFERNPEYREAFKSPEPAKILPILELLTGQAVRAGKSLLFLDEIQAAPEALAALRYFYEEMPELHVIAAGSLLEFTLAAAKFSMPVGRVEYFYLGPLQFEDFLEAMGEPAMAAALRTTTYAQLFKGSVQVQAVHEKYLALLRQFWVVGGLPEAVANFAEQRNFSAVGRVHQSVVATYRDDFSKYSHGTLRERVQLVFDKLPHMVGRKFKYVQVSSDHRAGELATALQQLCMARVAFKVQHTSANGVPLAAEVGERYFKALYLDVGLMCSALKLSLLDLTREDLTLVNAGAMAEQFIGQHLLYSGAWYEAPALYYWLREARGAASEVDYVISPGQRVVPIEVKKGKTGTLKSMQRFLQEKNCTLGLRFNSDLPTLLNHAARPDADAPLGYRLLSLPHYWVGQTRRLLGEAS